MVIPANVLVSLEEVGLIGGSNIKRREAQAQDSIGFASNIFMIFFPLSIFSDLGSFLLSSCYTEKGPWKRRQEDNGLGNILFYKQNVKSTMEHM